MVAAYAPEIAGAPPYPSMEWVRDALEAHVRVHIEAALEAVGTLAPADDVTGKPLRAPLRPPARYQQVEMRNVRRNQAWPTLVVLSGALSPAMTSDQGIVLWRGPVEVQVWEKHAEPETLTRIVDRYTAALWWLFDPTRPGAVEVAPWLEVLPDTVDFLGGPDDQTGPTERGRGVGFEVQLYAGMWG